VENDIFLKQFLKPPNYWIKFPLTHEQVIDRSSANLPRIRHNFDKWPKMHQRFIEISLSVQRSLP